MAPTLDRQTEAWRGPSGVIGDARRQALRSRSRERSPPVDSQLGDQAAVAPMVPGMSLSAESRYTLLAHCIPTGRCVTPTPRLSYTVERNLSYTYLGHSGRHLFEATGAAARPVLSACVQLQATLKRFQHTHDPVPPFKFIMEAMLFLSPGVCTSEAELGL